MGAVSIFKEERTRIGQKEEHAIYVVRKLLGVGYTHVFKVTMLLFC